MLAKKVLPRILAAKQNRPRCAHLSYSLDIDPYLYFTRHMDMPVLRTVIISIAGAAFLSASTAFACCTEVEAREALIAGNFDLAVSAAPQLGTNEAKLIAAEALNAKVLLGLAGDDKDAAKEALALAQSVLAADPDNKEAQFQYALADGFITRATSPFKAWRKKLPQKTKGLVDALCESTPEDGRAYALLGAWHMGILHKTGEKNGNKWFGANLAEGQAAYDDALTLRPQDIIITSNYALSLAELDFDANGPRARTMLVGVLAAAPKDAVEREVQSRMRDILNLWDDEKARMKRIEQFLDGKG